MMRAPDFVGVVTSFSRISSGGFGSEGFSLRAPGTSWHTGGQQSGGLLRRLLLPLEVEAVVGLGV